MPERFAQVDDSLFRGGAPEIDELPILRDIWGVKKIVSLDGESGQNIAQACRELGLEHDIIPLTDGNDNGFDKIAKEVSKWPKEGPVYVHCKFGKDRTGATCAMYRVLVDDWKLDDALAEAASFGMGWGVSKNSRKSYYDVVKRCVTGDGNSAEDRPDIVTQHRDLMEEVQPKPAPSMFNPVSSDFGSDSVALPGQQSFAPYLDVQQDHLNSPASRLDELRKLAAVRVFRVCRPSDVQIYNTLWANSPESAVTQSKNNLPDWQKPEAKLFSAVISDDADIITYPQEPAKPLIHAAMLKEADVVLFQPASGDDQYLVINPVVISDIKLLSDDQNDAPLVGLRDNYDGMANQVFPGGGTGMVPGLAGGAGGFAGFVQVPGEQL